MDRYALIVAGGQGTRMNSELPKQFLMLDGKPVIVHSIEKFLKLGPIKVIIVLPKDHVSEWSSIQKEFLSGKDIEFVIGGATRTESVKSGLDSIDGVGTVAIHDAVRPFISSEIIKKTFESAEIHGSGVVAVPLKDSLRRKTLDDSIAVDRGDFVIVQTPQTFRLAEIKTAYENISGTFTDDATVYEKAGFGVKLVEGDYSNIKITTREDLA